MASITFTELEKEFTALSSPGIIPGLDRIFMLLSQLGNPQDVFLSVHVVGTNGKGSTCAALASILGTSRLKVAVYTSPHLVSFGERLIIFGEQVSPERWKMAVGKVKTALTECEELKSNPPTYFELITAAAFIIIAGEGVDIAIIEAGLGGRLDATNTLGNVALTLVTPIGMDHMNYLGDDLLSIAREKFAVLRGDAPAIFSWSDPELEEEFCVTARKKGTAAFLLRDICAVYRVKTSLAGTDFYFDNYSGQELHTPLIGFYQAENAALAVCAAHILSGNFAPQCVKKRFSGITDTTIKIGIGNTFWPGRLEVVAESPPTILDGAHNPHAVNRLIETLAVITEPGTINIVLAIMKDKDASAILKLLKRLEPHVYCTQVPDVERSMPASELYSLARENGLINVGEYACPLEALKASRLSGRTIVCCGSLYLVGYLKGHLDEISRV